MAADVATLREMFPGVFAETPAVDTALERAMESAIKRVNRSAFGTSADEATIYMAAHLATLGTPARAMGATSMAAGPVSMTLGNASNGRTGFLDLYDGLKRSKILGVLPPT